MLCIFFSVFFLLPLTGYFVCKNVQSFALFSSFFPPRQGIFLEHFFTLLFIYKYFFRVKEDDTQYVCMFLLFTIMYTIILFALNCSVSKLEGEGPAFIFLCHRLYGECLQFFSCFFLVIVMWWMGAIKSEYLCVCVCVFEFMGCGAKAGKRGKTAGKIFFWTWTNE